jgi:sialate O-acetylesterase
MDRLAYHQKVELFPQIVNSSVQGSEITLTFDQPLRSVSANELEVAGADGRFVNAEASVDGKVVTIKSPVSSPKKLRYAWKDDPQRANLYGTNELPVAPFEITITN